MASFTKSKIPPASEFELIGAGRLQTRKTHPYMAQAIWAMVPIETPGLGTLAVDMWWRLYYDPEKVRQWPVEVIAGVLYHEVLHLLNRHARRCVGMAAEPRLWNIAADMEINSRLRKENVRLPANVVYPHEHGYPDGKLAEEYYQMLIKESEETLVMKFAAMSVNPNASSGGQGQGQGQQGQQNQSQQQGNQGQGGNSQGQQPSGGGGGSSRQQSGADQSNSSVSRTGNDPSQAPNAPGNSSDGSDSQPSDSSYNEKFPGVGAGICGSCATGRREEWEKGAPDGVNDDGKDEITGEMIRRGVARKIIEEHSRNQGKVPEHLARWAEEILTPSVDPAKVLASAVRNCINQVSGNVDYSRHSPNRRQDAYGDILLPTMYKPVPEVAIVIDTSGSMSDKQLAQAVGWTSRTMRALGCKTAVRVISCDAAVNASKKCFNKRQIELFGGGGTEMGKGLAYAAKQRPKPDVIIVITDCYTDWPASPPERSKVVVVRLDHRGQLPKWPCRVVEWDVTSRDF